MKLLNAVATLLLIASFCSACNRPAGPPLSPDAVILAFGDSLTKGKGVTEPHSYPAVLSNLIGHRVLNYGISGETTAEGRRRLPEALRSTTPNLVILMHGGNDILRNIKPTTTKANLAAMLEMIQKTGATVLLVGIPAKKLFSSSADIYPELAQEHDLMFDSSSIASLLRSPSMKSDLLHFNKQGYAELAKRLAEALVHSGVISEQQVAR